MDWTEIIADLEADYETDTGFYWKVRSLEFSEAQFSALLEKL